MRALKVALAAALILTSCSSSEPAEAGYGVVKVRTYHEGFVSMIPITSCSGNPSICSTTFIPIDNPPEWALSIDWLPRRYTDDGKPALHPAVLESGFHVGESDYDACAIGQWVTVDVHDDVQECTDDKPSGALQ